MDIHTLAKSLHAAGKAAGLRNLRVVRFQERGVMRDGATRYDGTVRGEPEDANGGTVEVFFWLESKSSQAVLMEVIQAALDDAEKEG